MNIERLQNLANTDFKNFSQSENNVKDKIIIPFLQAFNHVDLDLEHATQGSRIDINIGNRIIVETKALGQNINNHVQQLSDYCGKELPVLAILTNGRHYRIYSPQWRYLRTFPEKIIYEFELKDLKDAKLLNRLEKILGFSNYSTLEFIEHIEQREKEILKIKAQIDELHLVKEGEASEVRNEISKLKNQIEELAEQIRLKEQFVSDIENGEIPELINLASDYLIPSLFTKPDQLKANTQEDNAFLSKLYRRFTAN
jgi:predicted type IV restriction endonuclease